MTKKTKDLTDTPVFERELREKYNAGIAHTFVFYGATFDYLKGHTFLKGCLSQIFTKQSQAVKNIIVYDRADGITFPTASDKDAFMAVVGAELETFGGVLPKDPINAFELIGRCLLMGHFALIIDYAETVFPRGDMVQMNEVDRASLVYLLKWAQDNQNIRKLGNFIILITNTLSRLNQIITEPSSRIETIGIPYPNVSERLRFIEETIVRCGGEGKPLSFEDGFDKDFMSRATAGLARVHIQDIFLRSLMEKSPVGLRLVRERKNDIIKAEFQEVLQISEPDFGFELIGGYDYIKDYLRRNVIEAVRVGNTRRVPMGILMMGPGGTGKSVIAQALAKECGFNFAVFNIGRTKEKWVGNSEANLEKALWAISSLTPIVVFVDELDTALSRGGNGDSGVSANIMKRILEFMGETSHRGQIIWLSATNRPENIDFALKRAGRFDKKIPVLPPTRAEQPHIYMAMLKKYDIKHDLSVESISSLIEQTGEDVLRWTDDPYVGADIEAIVLKAFEISEDAGRDEVMAVDIKEAISVIKPSVQDIPAMTASALRECTDLSLLPEAYKKKAMKERTSNPDVKGELERGI